MSRMAARRSGSCRASRRRAAAGRSWQMASAGMMGLPQPILSCRHPPRLTQVGSLVSRYYGLRLHLRVTWPGVITAAVLAPANEADRAVAPQLLAGLAGWALGDGGYWSPSLRAELAPAGLKLIAPPPRTKAGAVRWPARLVQMRRRIETVLSQLAERYHAKRIRARDEWHLLARWLRKLASHTVAVLLCQHLGLPPLAFTQLQIGRAS